MWWFVSQAMNRAKALRLERGDDQPLDQEMPSDMGLDSDEEPAPLPPPTRGRGSRGRGSRGGRGRGELLLLYKVRSTRINIAKAH